MCSIRIAYLINQYPKISHTFIRREILALERRGIHVSRYSIEPTTDELADAEDNEELLKTRAVLSVGLVGLALAMIHIGLRKPVRWARTLGRAMRMGRRSDRGILRHVVYFSEACVLLRWFQQDQIDHVHAHFGTNPAMVALLCRNLGGPTYSFTAHGAAEFDQLGYIAIRDKIRSATATIAVTHYGRSQLMRWVESPDWSRIHVVRCGVSEKFIEVTPCPIPHDPVLLHIGRFSEEKGQIVLIQAAGLLKRRGVPFRLVLVGDGPLRGRLEALINKLELQGPIELAGWADERQIMEHLRAARAMVLPSFTEGLPVVIMEAFAMARPVISTYVAGIPELVRPGENGWLVPAGTVDPLADAMREALEIEDSELQRMGMAGRRRVLEEYNVDVEAEKLVALFQTGRMTEPESAVRRESTPGGVVLAEPTQDRTRS